MQLISLPAELPGNPIKRRNWASNLRRLKGRATSLKRKEIWGVQRQATLLLRRLQGKSPKPSIDLVFYRYMLDVYSVKVLPMINDFQLGRVILPPKLGNFRRQFRLS